MHDFIADWKKWSRAERVAAVVITLPMIVAPFGFLFAGMMGA
jgi:hypothetical protein